MDYYMKREMFRENVFCGKGVVVFDAHSFPDALRKAAEMMEHPAVRSDPHRPGLEERITVGPVVSVPI